MTAALTQARQQLEALRAQHAQAVEDAAKPDPNADAIADLQDDIEGAKADAYLHGKQPDVSKLEAQVAARRAGPPPIRPLNPDVTPAVEAIVRKLLAPEPADRYQSADDLRVDLERHLNDQPLRFARETSVAERFGKWRRRNPGLTVRLGAAAHMAGNAIGRPLDQPVIAGDGRMGELAAKMDGKVA